jgi:hypothetical protein
MNRVVRVLVFVVIAAGTIRFADAAVTDPELSFGGNSCVPYNGGTAVKFYLQGAYNTGTTSQTVLCPAPMKDPERLTGTTFAPVWLYNAGGTFSCTLYAMTVDGTVVGAKSMSTTYTGHQALYFDGPGTSSEWGSYVYVCSVPPSSYVSAYMVFEG